MEDSQIVAALSLELAERIGEQRFELWFGTRTRLCIEATCLTVHAASEFVRDWLRKNLYDDIRACWEAFVGAGATVNFAVEQQRVESRDDRAAASVVAAPPVAKQETTAPNAAITPTADVATGRADFTLAGFVVGGSNEYAFRAAQLIASRRQQASPVLFCGPTGVGKTHLLRAIVREYRRLNPASSAIYLTAEQFTTNFIEAVRGTGLPSFRQKCRGASLLVIDDLQFFAGKDRTIEELLYTVDTLVGEGRQIVLASDRSLADMRFLGNDLLSRLAGGLTCAIAPAEFATRRSIVRNLSRQLGVSLSDDVVTAIASQVNAGARELRGALHRLKAVSDAYEQRITRELAERTIAEQARHSVRTVRLADVQKAVCDVFGVEASELRSERKGRAVSDPRILAMWLARKYTRAPWSEIAHFFGRRSHSTVISAHRRVEKLINSQGQIGLSDRECDVEEAIRKLENALRTA